MDITRKSMRIAFKDCKSKEDCIIDFKEKTRAGYDKADSAGDLKNTY